MFELGNYKNYSAISSSRSSLLLNAFLRTCARGKYIALPWNVCTEISLSIINSGIIPYYIDINENFHVEEEEIMKIPNKVKMYLNIHQYGQWSPISPNIKKKFSIIIDDAAQAFGAGTAEKQAGFDGDLGLFSFGKSKHINIGGGLCLTRNKHVAKEITNYLKNLNFFDTQVANKYNTNILFRKIYDFENNKNVDWNSLKFRYKVLKPSIKLHNLQKYFNYMDKAKTLGDKRLKKAKELALLLPKHLGKITNLNDKDSPWRVNINANHLSKKKYTAIFNLIRSNKILVSNWYYPSHLIFKDKSIKNFNTINKYQKFQFLISNKKEYIFIDNLIRNFDK